MIGRTLGHFRILEKLGQGGMGEVYLAEDQKLRRKVAIKVLPEDMVQDRERRARFLQEALAAAAVEHPHIAAVYEIDEADGRTFIAMEYVRGRDLRAVLGDGALAVPEALKLATQVADALAVVHERGILHRDLKPENLLVADEGYAKILDFGLAKLVERRVPGSKLESGEETQVALKTADGQIVGTVAYMSPEQVRGEELDPRTDIFSFGIILREMVSGISPFRRETNVESLHAILKEDLEPVEEPGIPEELRRIIRKCMAKDAGARYQSTRDLALDLRALREVSAGIEHRPAATASSRRKGLVAATMILLSMVVVAAIFVLRGRPSSEEPHAAGLGPSGRPAIAVLNFESAGSEEAQWLSRGLPGMLLTGLAQTPGLDVVSNQRLREVAAQMASGSIEDIGPGVWADVARQAGAGAVVVGSIFQSAGEFRIDLQVEDLATGTVLFARSVQGTEVFPLVDELTGEIRGSLDLPGLASDDRITELTTDSLEAYRVFTRGVEARQNMRHFDAKENLEEAVALDPRFAMAYRELTLLGPGMLGSARFQEYRQSLTENLDRLPERQRLLVLADEAAFEEDWDAAERHLNALLQRYPDEVDGYIRLFRALRDRPGRLADALSILERGSRELPTSGPILNALGYTYLDGQQYEEAIGAFESYARVAPREPNPHDSLGETYLRSGRLEEALSSYQRALDLDPRFFPSHGGRFQVFAVAGRYDEALDEAQAISAMLKEGQLPQYITEFMQGFSMMFLGRHLEANENYRAGLRIAEEFEVPLYAAAHHVLGALLALEQGDPVSARSRAGQALEAAGEVGIPSGRRQFAVLSQLVAGAAAARSGDLVAARADLDAQRKAHDPDDVRDRWWVGALEGEIALADGDPEAAERAFLSGEPEGQMWFGAGVPVLTTLANSLPFRDGSARALAAQGDLDGAIRLYRELLQFGPRPKWIAQLYPRHVLALARLLDETGETAEAAEHYRRFLELWKDADPGRPELEEVRSRLAELGA